MFKEVNNIPFVVHTGFPITQAVVDGHQEGRIFAFEDNYFILHKSGFASLINDTDCLNELGQLFLQESFPQYFHIYDATPELIRRVNKDSSFFNAKVRKRIQMEYPLTERIDLFKQDFTIEAANEEDLNKLSVFGLNLSNRYWKNSANFLDNAMARVVYNQAMEPGSICYAAAVSNNRAEVDVATIEVFKGLGLAKLAVSRFVNLCIQNNIIPNWDCFEDNVASLRVAESLKFVCFNSYDFLSIFKTEGN